MRFGGFVLDPTRAELRDPAGAAVPLRPKTRALLEYLFAHAGRVVGRKEILDAVWPGVTVGDESLSQAVAELRRTLGPDGGRLIRTVPRRGYMLDAKVTADPPPGAEEVSSRPQPAVEAGAGVAIPRETPPALPPRPGLERAVRLGAIWALPLGLAGLLVGWRLLVAPTPAPLAGAAPRVAASAAGTEGAADAAPAPGLGRRTAEALHAEGLHIARDTSACRPRWLEALPVFERTTAADPGFAPARAQASYAHSISVSLEASLNPAEDLGAAERLAREAIALAPDDPDGHAALGDALRRSGRDAEALAAYRSALALGGDVERARGNMGLTLLALGQAIEAGDAIRAALATADRGSGQVGNWLHALGLAELHLGRGDHGAENFRRSLARAAVAPYDVRRLHFAAALALGGRVEDARAVAADARVREPELGIAHFRARAASDHPAYLAGREVLYRGLALAGVPEEGGRTAPSRLASPSCVSSPSPYPPAGPAPVAAPPPTPRQEAWRLFRQGEEAFWGSRSCPLNWLSARGHYEAATAADPSFAPAYSNAVFTYTNLLRNGLSPTPAEDLRTAERLAERAAALAPDLPNAHGARGSVLASQGRREEALAAYRRGVALDGDKHAFRAQTGFLLIRLGRAEEAEAPLRASIALDPENWFRGIWQVWLGEVDLLLGRGDFGARHFRASLSGTVLITRDTRRLYLAAALALGGRAEDVRAVAADVLAREPGFSVAIFRRGERSGHPLYRAQREALYRGLALAGLPEWSDEPTGLARVACGEQAAALRQPAPSR